MIATQLDRVRGEFEDSEFFRFLGLEITTLEEGDVELRLPYKPELDNVRSTVHGGVYMSVLDTVMGLFIRSLGYDDTMTIQMQTQFLKPLVGGAMTARAELINKTRSTVLLEGRLYNESGELIGHATGTFKVMKFD
ncbi:PaaI family thioesterase [Edaphobacillus lindanitolerans]|uniref:Medium/long-chain acyl-CoA thioesterase YigI n=1 Tax=Edaphobacillus lindanitolerans TaxID=550447 RepID=A0A1U7PKH2_9BACI|nr:PaaI family thioesterase [Edaphobacillus lindanitolerans]SIT71135.1 acyl-CoA thioesterase [Edaphobacillus lindanitolerans]